jgi:parallel beta-helix repeat protein
VRPSPLAALLSLALLPAACRAQEPGLEPLILAGAARAGHRIDCQGGWLLEGRPVEVRIQSLPRPDGSWERPDGVRISHCRLRGAIRVIGLGRNGEAEGVRLSSRQPGHSPRAQAAAPHGVVLEGLELEAVGPIPVYAGPGTVGLQLRNSRLTGESRSVAVYLDAESRDNLISGNRFELSTARERIAVDGSASNRIDGNRFSDNGRGGIFLYRNCGEGGTVRHQPPVGNLISGNHFSGSDGPPAVWLGSRNGRRPYCGQDAGLPFGSSSDDGDQAEHNRVEGNGSARVQNDGSGNTVRP